MLKDLDTEPYIVRKLEEYAGCTVVLTNQTAPAPPYPYISYTVIAPVHSVDGTYCMQNGIYYQPMLQTWSLTAHSDESRDCQQLGMRMYDFFARAGRLVLHRKQIAVDSKTNLSSRDNLLTVQFEYRCGMDVTFRLMHQLDVQEGEIKQADMRIRMLQNKTEKE